MTCQHMHLNARVAVQRVCREDNKYLGEDAPVEAYVLETQVHCAECGIAFHFQWSKSASPHEPPMGIDEMKTRPWISYLGETLHCTIVPVYEVKFPNETGPIGHA